MERPRVQDELWGAVYELLAYGILFLLLGTHEQCSNMWGAFEELQFRGEREMALVR